MRSDQRTHTSVAVTAGFPPDAGELLAVMSAGAYGFSLSSNYNSRPRVAEVLVRGDSYQIIRRRETYEDLIRLEHRAAES